MNRQKSLDFADSQFWRGAEDVAVMFEGRMADVALPIFQRGNCPFWKASRFLFIIFSGWLRSLASLVWKIYSCQSSRKAWKTG